MTVKMTGAPSGAAAAPPPPPPLAEASQKTMRELMLEAKLSGLARRHDERVTELLAANKLDVDRRRLAESKIRVLVAMTQAEMDILLERRRQTSHEGYTTEHDDRHGDGSMAAAAAAYALPSPDAALVWPWNLDKFKPKDRRRNLVRAGALISAEVERLDRITERG